MNKDNHLGRLRDNSYDKEQYYDERYDQTDDREEEIRNELKKALEPCRAYDFEDYEEEKEVNIDNFYNELADD